MSEYLVRARDRGEGAFARSRYSNGALIPSDFIMKGERGREPNGGVVPVYIYPSGCLPKLGFKRSDRLYQLFTETLTPALVMGRGSFCLETGLDESRGLITPSSGPASWKG